MWVDVSKGGGRQKRGIIMGNRINKYNREKILYFWDKKNESLAI